MLSVEVRARVSWVNVPGDSDFTLYNLPYGVFSTRASSEPPHCGVAIGDSILDLAAVAHLLSCVQGLDITCFSKGALNAFMAHPANVWEGTRRRITALLEDGPEGCNDLRNDAELRTRALLPLAAAKLHLPAEIGDYTDFYASREHAYNCGSMFRSPETALQPNWLHLPVGYHGRSSSVCISGTPVIRPQGQIQRDKNDASKGSVFANCNMLDFECEVGYFLGGPANKMGVPLSMDEAESRIFGFVLLNDWSARDIQAWEYVPLGPFLSKNFATSISPWVVPYEAMQAFACPTSCGKQDPSPLRYLEDANYSSFDLELTIAIQGGDMTRPERVSTTNMKNLYWNVRQMLVHHASSGCIMRPGDLLGTGTISGSDEDSWGSLLELSWRGTREVHLGKSGHVRRFLQDHDTVLMQGRCWREVAGVGRVALGFGPLQGTVLPQGSRPKSEQLLHPCEQVQQLQQLQQLRAVSASPESTWPETGEDMTQRSYPESAPPPAATLAGQSVTLAGHWPESTPPPPPALELVEADGLREEMNELKRLLHDMTRERDALTRERDALRKELEKGA